MRSGPRESLDALARAWAVTAFGIFVVALVALASEASQAPVVAKAWNELAPAFEAAMGGFAG
jgi:hypothetical protein